MATSDNGAILADMLNEAAGPWAPAWAFVNKRAWDPEWQQAICCAAGRLEEPATLLRILADNEEDDYFRHRAALSALCLAEIAPARWQEYRDVVNHITGVVFLRWWDVSLLTLSDDCYDSDYEGFFPHLDAALPSLAKVNGEVEPGQPLLSWLCDRMKAPSSPSEIQTRALLAVGRMGQAAATDQVLNALGWVLGAEYDWVNDQAEWAVGRLGEAAVRPPFLLGVSEGLRDGAQEGDVPDSVMALLEILGLDLETDNTQRPNYLEVPWIEVVDLLAEHLSKAGSSSPRAALRAAYRDVRASFPAAPSLRPEPVPRDGATRKTCHDGNPPTGNSCTAPAHMAGPVPTVDEMIELFRPGPTDEVRKRVEGLWNGGERHQARMLDAIAQMLASDHAEDKRAAASLLGNLRAAAAAERDEICEELKWMLGLEEPRDQQAAVWAVQGMGVPVLDSEVVELLIELLGSTDTDVGLSVRWALKGFMEQGTRFFEVDVASSRRAGHMPERWRIANISELSAG